MRSNRFHLLSVVGGMVLGMSVAGLTKTAHATLGSAAGTRSLDADDDKAKDAKKEEEPKGDPVDVDKLPKAVVDAVKKEMPGARITKAMKLEDGTFYLDDVKVGKKLWDVTITPKGKIVKKVEMKE